MIPPVADTDPDPTTQIPWPSTRNRQPGSDTGSSDGPESSTVRGDSDDTTNKAQAAGRRRLSTWDLITLSISMAGAQIAWTVELG